MNWLDATVLVGHVATVFVVAYDLGTITGLYVGFAVGMVLMYRATRGGE